MNRPEHFPPKYVAHPIGRGIRWPPRPHSSVSHFCCKGVARSALIKLAFTRRLSEDVHPDWVAGISIGAINAAVIAGNPPEARVDRLRGFWEAITTHPVWDWPADPHADRALD